MQCKLINDWIAIARTAKLYYHQGTYFPCGVSFKNVCGTCIWNSWPVGSEAKEPFIRPQGKNTSTTRSRWGNQVRYELYELYETQMKQNGQWTWTSEKDSPLKKRRTSEYIATRQPMDNVRLSFANRASQLIDTGLLTFAMNSILMISKWIILLNNVVWFAIVHW